MAKYENCNKAFLNANFNRQHKNFNIVKRRCNKKSMEGEFFIKIYRLKPDMETCNTELVIIPWTIKKSTISKVCNKVLLINNNNYLHKCWMSNFVKCWNFKCFHSSWRKKIRKRDFQHAVVYLSAEIGPACFHVHLLYHALLGFKLRFLHN